MDPAITNKKKETQEKVESIRNQKKMLIDSYREQCRLYDEQKFLIEKAEWMTTAKARLIKYKIQKKEEDDKRKKEEEERKEINDNVYSEEIRLCQFLIRYCSQFQKKEI